MSIPLESGATKKETNILILSIEISKALADFQARLDNRFDRNRKDCEADEGKPSVGNILDEIIGNLEADLAHLNRITSFISSDVLPKIN